MTQIKILILALMVPLSALYADNNIIILNKEEASDIVDMLIEGNEEQCSVSMDSMGAITETTCLHLTNSKKIKILCTAKKKMCKSVSEVQDALKAKPSSGTGISTPSFDCAKASTQTEHDICHSDKVSALDLELGNIYLEMKSEMPIESFKSLVAIQKDWVKDRDVECGAQSNFAEREKCLIEVYKKRIDAFSLISVMDYKINYADSFSSIYEHGTSEERFGLSSYFYYQEKNTKKATKLLRKIVADNQEGMISAFFALGDIHEDYTKEFPQVSKELLKENRGSIGISLMDLNATHNEVIKVLIEEGYLLNTSAQVMLSIKYQFPIKGQYAYDKRILSYYEECAEEGMPRCEEFLGKIYINGLGVKKDIYKAIQLLKQSELGDAYMTLAEYYYLRQDMENCKIYYKKASALGEYKATYNLGVLAQEEKEYKKAIDYFNASLEKNDKYYPSMQELARMHIEGWGTEFNFEKAIDLLQIIVDNSDEIKMIEIALGNLSIAEYELGLKYLRQKDSNKTKAFILLEKSAKNNNMHAQYQLAKMYSNGDGVKKDERQVIKWYKKAAEQGHAEAQLLLSFRYLDGIGVEKDNTKGLYWVKKSAENGNLYGQYLYATLILDDKRNEAIKWLEKSAKQGYKFAKEKLSELKNNTQVIGVQTNKLPDYKKACDAGIAQKCYGLGNIYYYGVGVKENYLKAIEFYKKACNGGSADGCYRLGNMYFFEEGLIQDYFKVVELYKKACDGASAYGCYALGNRHMRGEGVRQNKRKAKELFGKACTLKYQEGCDRFRELNEEGY